MALLTLAIAPDDSLRFIADVASGRACGCICPACRSPLIAKKGDILEWHFAHEPGQERPECEAGALNLFARLMLEYLQSLACGPTPPRAGGATITRIDGIDASSRSAMADLSNGQRLPVRALPMTSRGIVPPPADGTHLLFSCGLPPIDILAQRGTAESFIAHHGRLTLRAPVPRVVAPAPAGSGAWRGHAAPPMGIASPPNSQPARGSPIYVYVLVDGSNWLLHKTSAGGFVLRQWPEPAAGWDSRFPRGVGTAHPSHGVYSVPDFLSASSHLRALSLDNAKLECASLEAVERTVEAARSRRRM